MVRCKRFLSLGHDGGGAEVGFFTKGLIDPDQRQLIVCVKNWLHILGLAKAKALRWDLYLPPINISAQLLPKSISKRLVLQQTILLYNFSFFFLSFHFLSSIYFCNVSISFTTSARYRFQMVSKTNCVISMLYIIYNHPVKHHPSMYDGNCWTYYLWYLISITWLKTLK